MGSNTFLSGKTNIARFGFIELYRSVASCPACGVPKTVALRSPRVRRHSLAIPFIATGTDMIPPLSFDKQASPPRTFMASDLAGSEAAGSATWPLPPTPSVPKTH